MRKCDFCHTEEGKCRPIGRFVVKLKQVNVLETKKLACQSCFHKERTIIKARRRNQEHNHDAQARPHFKDIIVAVFHS